jgi:hypothetical protein
MKITGVVWLEEVVEKIESKHGVTQTEVEQVLSLTPKVRKMVKGRLRARFASSTSIAPWERPQRGGGWRCSSFTNALVTRSC